MNRYKFIDEKKAHLHTLDEKPLIGTSTVLSVLAKNLTWWAAELSAVACLEVGEKIPTIREEYLLACASGDKKEAIDALQKKYPIFKTARFAHFNDKNTKADSGTDMHSELEKYVKFCMSIKSVITTTDRGDKVNEFSRWAVDNVEAFILSEAQVYSEKLWIGGGLDVFMKMKNGQFLIGDFKSSKEAYDSQFLQCSGYDLQLSENGAFTADGIRLLEPHKVDGYVIFPFGGTKFTPAFRYNTEELKKGFEACLTIYKLQNK